MGCAPQSVRVFVLARVSGNAHFGLAVPPTTTIAPKWAEFRVRCGNDLSPGPVAESWPKIVVPPSLETCTIRGFPHFHSDVEGGLLTATTIDPTKMGSLTDSCTAKKCLTYGLGM